MRVHRRTHPTLGMISWVELKKRRPSKTCSWCFKDLSGTGCRSRCGKEDCEIQITNLIHWGMLAHRIMRRDEFKCTRCGKPAMEVDHIIPVSLGGSGDDDNLRSLCQDCHKSESARLSRERENFIASLRILPETYAASADDTSRDAKQNRDAGIDPRKTSS